MGEGGVGEGERGKIDGRLKSNKSNKSNQSNNKQNGWEGAGLLSAVKCGRGGRR